MGQGGKTACVFFSLKSAADTPCTWTAPPVELANGDAHTGLKWYLPATPGDDLCAPCPNGMICDGLNFRKPTTTTVTTTPTSTTSKPGWMLGEPGQSCSSVCASVKDVCKDSRLSALKDQPNAVKAAFADAGFPCRVFKHSCSTGNHCAKWGAPYIHKDSVANLVCNAPGTGDAVATCAQVPSDRWHRRLCPCGNGQPTKTTKPVTTPSPAPKTTTTTTTRLRRTTATKTTKTTTTGAITTTRVKVPKTCYSVGDPHLKTFDGVAFDSHAVGWKTLYAKGNLKIELEQAKFKTGGVGVAVNRAVRYSTNGGTSWDEMIEDGALLSSGTTKTFSNPNVKLTVKTGDFSRFSWAQVSHIYNVYVTTSDYAGATGQCTQGKLRRRLNSDTSDGVVFPSGTAVKVSKDQAEQACAGLTGQKANCVTDLRMVNEPAAVEKIAQDFEQVETTVTKLKVVGQLVVDGATTKHFCWSALALIIGLML